MKCSIPECENELNPKSKLGICSLCRGNVAGWAKKPPGQFIQRCKNLRRFTSRMIEVQSKGDLDAKRGVREKTSRKNSQTAAEYRRKIGADLERKVGDRAIKASNGKNARAEMH